MSDNPKMPRVIKVYNDPDTTTHTMKGCDFWAGVSGTAGWAGKQTEYTLKSQADALAEALKEGRRAIGDHNAPSDCYATGPLTGDPIRDLVQCPACSFIAMYDAALAAYQEGE